MKRFWSFTAFLLALSLNGFAAHANDDASLTIDHCLAGDPFRESEKTAELCQSAMDQNGIATSVKARMLGQLGEAQYWLMSFPNAIKSMNAALETDPTLNETRIELAWAIKRTGNSKAAFDLFNEALKRDPKSARAIYALGQYFEYTNQSNVAKQAFTEALQLDPNYDLARLEFTDYYRYVEPNKEKVLENFNEILTRDEALVNKARFFSRATFHTKDLYGLVVFEKAAYLVETSNFPEARKSIDWLLMHYPNEGEPHGMLAVIDFTSQDYEGAIREINDERKLPPDCNCYYNMKLMSEYRLKRFDDVLQSVEVAKKLPVSNWNHNETFFFEGLVRKKRGETVLARDAMIRSISGPDNYLPQLLTQLIQSGYYVGQAQDKMNDRVLSALDACLVDSKCMAN